MKFKKNYKVQKVFTKIYLLSDKSQLIRKYVQIDDFSLKN